MFARKRIIESVNKGLALQEAIKITKILVIDDEDTFPIKLMQNEGYNITKWNKVESISRLDSGEFDIIVLDIHDVAKEFSKDDGLGVLEHLKKYNPGQIIVAYSGKTFDLSKNRFWKLADDFLVKPSDFVTCKEVIDKLVEDKMNVMHYWQALVKVALDNGISQKDIRKVEKRLAHAIKKNRMPSSDELFNGIIKVSDLVLKIATIIIPIIFRLGAT